MGTAIAAQNQPVDVSANFTPDGSNATIKYAVVELVPSSTKAQVTVDEATGKLTIKGDTNEEFTIIVSMTQLVRHSTCAFL